MVRHELLTALATQIDAIRCDHAIRVGIDGCDTAGKTTLADELVNPLCALGRPVIRASIDGFHNPSAIRYRRGRDSRALEKPFFVAHLGCHGYRR